MLDARLSAELKAQGVQLALELAGPWKETVVEEFRGWAAIQRARGETTCTIEQFRSQARQHPKSANAWGALPGKLVEAGLIRPSLNAEGEQRRRRAAAPKTHAHPVLLWEFT